MAEILSNYIPAMVALAVIIFIPIFNKIAKAQDDTDYELLTELYAPLHHYFTHDFSQDRNLVRLSEILYQNYYHLSDDTLKHYAKLLEGNKTAIKSLMDETVANFSALRNKLYYNTNYGWLSIYSKVIVLLGIIAIAGMVFLTVTDKANHLSNSWSMTIALIALALIYVAIHVIIYFMNRNKFNKMIVR